MEVYLLRHAIAEERSADRWPDDGLRPLSARGVDRMRQVVRGMSAAGLAFDLILTSPLARARATAAMVAAGLDGSPGVVEMPALAPGGSTRDVLEGIPRRKGLQRVLLVGHEPDLSRLAGDLSGARIPLVFKKGGLCRIDFPGPARAGSGALAFHLPPRFLRRLGA